MTDNDRAVWRDEESLPLSELERAMGAPANDGEVDDVTGNDAGAESAFGHGAEVVDGQRTSSAEKAATDAGGREMTDPERPFRPSTTGRSGPS